MTEASFAFVPSVASDVIVQTMVAVAVAPGVILSLTFMPVHEPQSKPIGGVSDISSTTSVAFPIFATSKVNVTVSLGSPEVGFAVLVTFSEGVDFINM